MRRFWILLCFALLLTGCTSWQKGEMLTVKPHESPYAQEETEPVEEISSYTQLKAAIREQVESSLEHNALRISQYKGNLDKDMEQLVIYMTGTDPIGAYAIDYMSYDRVPIGADFELTVDMVFRRSAAEVAAIVSVRGMEAAEEAIKEALTGFATSLTLRVTGYQETDVAARIADFCREHPDQMIQTPEYSVAVYPDRGNVRVLELHFTYTVNKETLRTMLEEVTKIMNSASGYIRVTSTERTKIDLIYSFLTSPYVYRVQESDTPAYSLLCQGIGSSSSFASLYRVLCEDFRVECRVVEGTKDGEPYQWNMVTVEGLPYHLDVLAGELHDLPRPQLLTDDEMERYDWDREAYPACTGKPTEEPPETPLP